MHADKKNACVVISGASGAIGGSLASLLLSKGYSVIGISRSMPSQEMRLKSPDVSWLIYDSSLSNAETYVVDELTQLIGSKSLMSVFHCSGQHSNSSPMDLTHRDYLDSIEGNLFSTINVVTLTLNLVCSGGSIIVLNSQAAVSASDNEIAYGVAKRAVSSYIDGMQIEATKRGLQIVNVLCGAVQSSMAKGRSGYDKFISLSELSEVLYSLSIAGKSLRLKDVEVLRRCY